MTFVTHTLETAPAAARRSMEGVVKHLGRLPDAVGRLAESPETLSGFLQLTALFEKTTLDPLSREVVVMTVAVRNGCHICVAMHTAALTRLDADPAVIAALRDAAPLPDPRLEAVRLFALEAIATTGAVPEDSLDAFLAHGFTRRNALEVVLGLGTYTISTFANRLTGAPIDPALKQYA